MQTMAVDRLLPSQDAEDLITLTRDIADKVLDPIVDAHEKAGTYPEGVFAQLGAAGLLSLPQPEEWGGGGQPYEVYLQVLEEIAVRWAAVAVALSVHSLSSHPLLAFGSEEQRRRWLPGMLSGEQIGAYSLSEPQAGSDAAALRCAATKVDGGGYVIIGSKSWITHGGRADFYTLFARTGEGSRGISCFLIPKDLPRLSFGKPEEKMGLHAVPTTSAFYDHAHIEADRLIGAEGQACRSPSPRWIRAGWALPRSPSGWRRRHWTRPRDMRTSERRSAARSLTIRGWASCWPTWPQLSPAHGPRTSTPRAGAIWVGRIRRRPAWPSWWPPTRR
jgi:alkylation response protein AidB-like acyl-CoA dehydrogenase